MKERRVVFYGRVSTEHEEQTQAFENQMEWYKELLEKHPEWIEVKEPYTDPGVTGTLAKKRKGFMKMLEDARSGMFDLIVTREISRFARNYVEAGEYVRELEEYGVEIFFANEGIYSFDKSSLALLGILSVIAESDSRKISERVKAGQAMSRKNGILYGNGNILGYDLCRNIDENGNWKSSENTYVINPEQAETVRMIYNMYLDGLGVRKIQNELVRLKRKNANGEVRWCASKILRILHKKTYAGYLVYNQSNVNDPIKKKRVNNKDKSTWVEIKGNWEPIIDEDTWNKVQEKLDEKRQVVVSKQGNNVIIGKPESDDLWNNKLICKCGRKFRKSFWRMTKGKSYYGYQCFNQVNNGAASTRIKNGLSTEGYCDVSSIADWKLEMMAKYILEQLWTERRESIDNALELLKEYYISEEDGSVEKRIRQLTLEKVNKQKMLSVLVDKWIEGAMSNEVYQQKEKQYMADIEEYERAIVELEHQKINVESLDDVLVAAKKELEQQIDFSSDIVSHDILSKLIYKVVPQGDNKFVWYLNLSGKDISLDIGVNGRKGKAKIFWGEKCRYLSQNGTGCYR